MKNGKQKPLVIRLEMRTNNLFKNKLNSIILISVFSTIGIVATGVFFWQVRERDLTKNDKSESKLIVQIPTTTKAESTDNSLIFAGSGTNLSITRILAEAFEQSNPSIKIEIPPSIGSAGGIRAIADKVITVGLASRPLKEKEKALGVRLIPYAKVAIVIGVHPTVTDDNINFVDLVNIYKGTKSSWSNGKEIIVLTREPGDSSNRVLKKIVPGFKEAFVESQKAKRWTTLFTDRQANQTLLQTPFAIGLSDMGAIVAEKLPIKALKLNGVAPTAENLLNGKYPLVKTLYFVVPEGKLPADAKAFIDFVSSSKGEKLLKANGYVPVK